jgi:hypothetical protein
MRDTNTNNPQVTQTQQLGPVSIEPIDSLTAEKFSRVYGAVVPSNSDVYSWPVWVDSIIERYQNTAVCEFSELPDELLVAVLALLQARLALAVHLGDDVLEELRRRSKVSS